MPSSRFSGTERSLPIGTLPAERLLEEDLDARDPERGAMFILAVEVNALLEAEVPTLLVVFDLSFVSDMVLLLFDPFHDEWWVTVSQGATGQCRRAAAVQQTHNNSSTKRSSGKICASGRFTTGSVGKIPRRGRKQETKTAT